VFFLIRKSRARDAKVKSEIWKVASSLAHCILIAFPYESVYVQLIITCLIYNCQQPFLLNYDFFKDTAGLLKDTSQMRMEDL
jgi:hypothetical protein